MHAVIVSHLGFSSRIATFDMIPYSYTVIVGDADSCGSSTDGPFQLNSILKQELAQTIYSVTKAEEICKHNNKHLQTHSCNKIQKVGTCT